MAPPVCTGGAFFFFVGVTYTPSGSGTGPASSPAVAGPRDRVYPRRLEFGDPEELYRAVVPLALLTHAVESGAML